MTFTFNTANSAGNAVFDQLNALMTLVNSGSLVIYDNTGTWGGDPDVTPDGAVLATFTFSATAFTQAAATGTFPNKTKVATASFSASTVAAGASGTAARVALKRSAGNGSTVIAAGTVGTSGADINFNSVAFSSGANITISSFTLSLPE